MIKSNYRFKILKCSMLFTVNDFVVKKEDHPVDISSLFSKFNAFLYLVFKMEFWIR